MKAVLQHVLFWVLDFCSVVEKLLKIWWVQRPFWKNVTDFMKVHHFPIDYIFKQSFSLYFIYKPTNQHLAVKFELTPVS